MKLVDKPYVIITSISAGESTCDKLLIQFTVHLAV